MLRRNGKISAEAVKQSMLATKPGVFEYEIEDDILVTRNGCEILTKDAPKEIDEIEKLMKEKPIYIIK